jgi:hypothetical protein
LVEIIGGFLLISEMQATNTKDFGIQLCWFDSKATATSSSVVLKNVKCCCRWDDRIVYFPDSKSIDLGGTISFGIPCSSPPHSSILFSLPTGIVILDLDNFTTSTFPNIRTDVSVILFNEWIVFIIYFTLHCILFHFMLFRSIIYFIFFYFLFFSFIYFVFFYFLFFYLFCFLTL